MTLKMECLLLSRQAGVSISETVDLLLICGISPHSNLVFTEIGQKKTKYKVRGSSLGKSALLLKQKRA